MPRDPARPRTRRPNAIKCPICKKDAYYLGTRNGQRNDCCGLWSWDDAPLVDADTHEARIKAHEAFDFLWENKHMTRERAYRWLAETMGLSKDDCHIKQMDADAARKVINHVDEWRQENGLNIRVETRD